MSCCRPHGRDRQHPPQTVIGRRGWEDSVAVDCDCARSIDSWRVRSSDLPLVRAAAIRRKRRASRPLVGVSPARSGPHRCALIVGCVLHRLRTASYPCQPRTGCRSAWLNSRDPRSPSVLSDVHRVAEADGRQCADLLWPRKGDRTSRHAHLHRSTRRRRTLRLVGVATT